MNSTFSLTRYIYFEKIRQRQTSLQLISIILIFGALFCLTILIHSLGSDWSSFTLDIIRFISITSIIMGPIIFEPNLNKTNAIYLYTLPVSKTERFVSYIFKYVIIQPLLWISLIYISELLRPYFLYDLNERYSLNNFITDIYHYIAIIYAAQSICMIIYMSIRKYTVIISIIILFIIIYLITLIGLISSYIYFGYSITYPFTFLLDPILYMEKWTGAVATITLYSSILLNIVMTIGFWSVIYLKIKEFEL